MSISLSEEILELQLTVKQLCAKMEQLEDRVEQLETQSEDEPDDGLEFSKYYGGM